MDENRYGEILQEIRPRIIETPEEHERILSIAEGLMEKGEALREEEREALALLVLLIEAFESNVLDEDEDDGDEAGETGTEEASPHLTLQRLMSRHKIELDDIAPIFGNPHLAREALAGKRPISHGQARELGKYFRVPAKLFRE